MPDQKTILLAGGGTGGHLYPGIAVAEALARVAPDVKPIFLCTQKEIDRVILAPSGFEFIPQPVVPLVRNVGGLLRFWKAWRETSELVKKTLREREPAAVLGLGGYAAGAAVKIAGLKKIPTAILNPDVIPGTANQYLLKYVRAACCQFDETAEHVSPAHRAKLKTTGCPIRADILNLPAREAAARRLDLDPRLQTLTITGASLGALTVNEAVLEMLKSVKLQGWQVLHLSGREHSQAVLAGYRELGIAAHVVDFTPAMSDVWAVSDLTIARAGASTCAELTACGVPSILMPYPFHKDMHQRANANVLVKAGAAVLLDDLRDRRKNAERLRPIVESLLYDLKKRETMRDAARTLGQPEAAQNVASILNEMMVTGR